MQEQTHIFMAIALAKQKKYDEAIAHYLAALKLNPDSAVTHNNLARIYHTQGRLDDAIKHYNAALEIDPKLSLAHNNLGILLLQKGNPVEGTKHLREALEIQTPETQNHNSTSLWPSINRTNGTKPSNFSKKTSGIYAADPKAHYEFALALAHLKRMREAMGEYASALLIQPDFPPTHLMVSRGFWPPTLTRIFAMERKRFECPSTLVN